jgi:hypothetical protein
MEGVIIRNRITADRAGMPIRFQAALVISIPKTLLLLCLDPRVPSQPGAVDGTQLFPVKARIVVDRIIGYHRAKVPVTNPTAAQHTATNHSSSVIRQAPWAQRG